MEHISVTGIGLFMAVFLCVSSMLYFYGKKNKATKDKKKFNIEECVENHWQYKELKYMLQKSNISLPCMIVDLDILDKNIQTFAGIARKYGKTIRIATKSVRCPYLIQYIVNKDPDIYKGFMCYSVEEAMLLSTFDLDDFYIAYPTLQYSDLEGVYALMEKEKKVTLTVDSIQCVLKLSQLWQKFNSGKPLCVAIDLDMSYKIGGFVSLGAHRSNVSDTFTFHNVVLAIKGRTNLQLTGVLGYEAHIAGLPDRNPYGPFPNFVMDMLKGQFLKQCIKLRADISHYCQNNVNLSFFNGGGSGNVKEACADEALTEVTVGSGILQAKLFDYYKGNTCLPAFCFALQVTRVKPDYVCCQSGGFIASGAISKDKQPLPFGNPIYIEPYSDEGFGEVQTPLKCHGKNNEINLGAPLFFRPAKSGEIAEHFNFYHLKRGYNIERDVHTYRGLGKVFY